MAKIITAGRTDTKDLFEIGDPFQLERLNHTPFLVFVEDGDTIHVEIVNSKKKLLAYPDETKVMVQWRGEFSSDFFQFTVGDYRPYAPEEKPKLTQEELWLQAKRIIKWTGANGGFIYLSYELSDPDQVGKFVQKGQSDKFYAKPMLKFFEDHNIAVVERKARNRQEVYEKLGMRR
jgi:hypothetical protein